MGNFILFYMKYLTLLVAAVAAADEKKESIPNCYPWVKNADGGFCPEGLKCWGKYIEHVDWKPGSNYHKMVKDDSTWEMWQRSYWCIPPKYEEIAR